LQFLVHKSESMVMILNNQELVLLLIIPYGPIALMKEATANVLPISGTVLKSTVNLINLEVLPKVMELQMEDHALMESSEILYMES